MPNDRVPGGDKTTEGLEKEQYESWLSQERARLLEEESEQDYIGKNENMPGLFAKHDFGSGEIISTYLIGKYDELFTLAKLREIQNKNGIQIGINNEGEGLYITVPGAHPRNFVNHSCDPNAGIRIEKQPDGASKSFLVTIKPIKKDEEITLDYATLMFEDWSLDGCKCGNPNCRHTINEFQKLPKELQDKYIKLGIIPEFAKDLRA